ncbi:MAG: hypothetical protein HRT35_37265, partial [Algicola sp.]|nr:hypothetical protein [Algicola sp.]
TPPAGHKLCTETKLYELQSTTTPTAKTHHQTQSQHKATLQNCFSMLINSVQYLQTNTRGYLEQAMSNPTHEPALGLLMVFLKLFGKAQQQLNRFTGRHRDFYYQDILGFSPMGVKPDSAYLQLALAPGSKGLAALDITTGTRFSAGKDKKFNDIVYSADEQVTVTDAKVEQLLSLYLQRDPLISPERELHYVTRVSGNHLDLTVDPGFNAGAQNRMAVFGADPLLSETKTNTLSVPLGIGISAPVLYLKEGQRKIEIVIGLGEPNKISPHFLTELNKNANDAVLVEQGLCDIFAILLNAEPDLIPNQLSETTQNPQNALFDEVDTTLLKSITKTKGAVQTALIYKAFLMALLQLAEAKPLFRRVLGRIFSRHTLSRLAWLSEADIEFIAARCQQICPGDELNRIVRLLEQDKLRTFYELYDDMFTLEITTELGWLPIEGYAIHPVDERAVEVSDNFYGFKFELSLKQDFPAVVPCDVLLHGENWILPHPAIQFMVKPEATFFPYSIFRGLLLNTILIDVDVKGVTELVTYNNQGRLDPSKPFNPFGPQPGNHSYMVFGGEELAQKQLQQVSLNLEWAQLPTAWDGFADHYQGYDDKFDNDCFKADIALLRDGQWNTVGQPGYALFQSQPGGNRLAANQCLSVIVEHEFKPTNTSKSTAGGSGVFEYNLKSRNGFFKLSLAEPQNAFGHQQYANVLTTTLVANSKNKKQKKLPNLPYTPLLSRFTLDYSAAAIFDLNAVAGSGEEH